ncbi:CaiB/BaiF CoA transferase family protein [Seohaeicola zhoushanensis]|uniref:CoA transferase n=1 Tax=Seohaeicola zhoushanensis TaxID=1569283 RepID=A0A8J3H174_9RHOB|nr:CoA transferase [Seohaeicola zhoushanensis]GHF62186.1 CoA transferase [Seohaeicola zhoushanensis]
MTKRKFSGPLRGMRILEIGHFIAAPFCTRLLADLGADVVKVEPLSGDPVRKWGDSVDGKSLWWSVHARNKRSVAVNLKAPGAAGVILRLVRDCDALVENFRPGQLARMGLSNETLRRENPALVIGHVSGYGQDGPYRDRAAFGVIGEAIGGLRHLSDHPPGTSDLPPVRVGVSIGDSLAGLYAALGIVSALWQRDRAAGDGRGRTVDVALTESVLSLMEGMLPEYGETGKVRQPSGSRIPTAAPSSAYPTRDGKWVLIAGNSEPLFQRLCALMGGTDLAGDPRFCDNPSRVANVAALDDMIGAWTCQFEAATLLDLLEKADVPATRIYDAADCAADPQFRHREMVREVEDPLFGKALTHPGIVPKVTDDPGEIRWCGAAIGEHTDEVLAGSGFTLPEIAALREKEIIA